MTEHRKLALKGHDKKLYNHMREIGLEHFKILCIREYKGLSKERLICKEDKYIKRFNTVTDGLNSIYAFGQICEHKVRRVNCEECGGSAICPHHKRKSNCKECGGSYICPHDRLKNQCRECGGSSICPHDKIRAQCKECGGSSICPHNKQKSQCKECKGSGICLHSIRKSYCKVCSPAVCDICSKVLSCTSSLKRHKNKIHSSSPET